MSDTPLRILQLYPKEDYFTGAAIQVRELALGLRAHRTQIVHAQKGKARTLALLAGLVVRIPVLVLNRGVSFPLDPLNRLGYSTRRVTAIVAVCESIKRGLVRQGVAAEKIEVIY